MIYVSLDCETSGLDSENCQILSFGAIIEDTTKKLDFKDIPKFHAILLYDRIVGEPFALNMNKDLIGLINQYQIGDKNTRKALEEVEGSFLYPDNLFYSFNLFLHKNGLSYNSVKITVAGKNFSTFDKLFLEKLPEWNKYFKIHQRVIDPAILFTDWENDEELPNLTKCKQRASIKGEVIHHALADSWDVIQVLRTKY